jgi:hypothetical protein
MHTCPVSGVFFAAQQGISSKPQVKESKMMLMTILDSLEAVSYELL